MTSNKNIQWSDTIVVKSVWPNARVLTSTSWTIRQP